MIMCHVCQENVATCYSPSQGVYCIHCWNKYIGPEVIKYQIQDALKGISLP